jgi:hypothetical protein
MVTVEDILDYIPEENPILIEKTIKRVEGFLISYTGNKELFRNDEIELEDVVLYLVLARLNPDTKNSQGKTSEGIGNISFSFTDDLPIEVKWVLSNYMKVEIL